MQICDSELKKRLDEKLLEWGATFTGYCTLKEGVYGLNNAATVGIRLSDAIVNEISDRPTHTYYHHYRTVNALIDQICLKGTLFIQEMGYDAIAVPASQTINDSGTAYSGLFPHKTAAVEAGLGWIGRSGLFISNRYGPRVRLGTILTNMPFSKIGDNRLPDDLSQLTEEERGRYFSGISQEGCGNCRLCVESCPALALTGDLWTYGCSREQVVDAKACSDYMKSRFNHIGRGMVCGICMRVCPKGMGR
jgi:epoxyqueuosine reductase